MLGVGAELSGGAEVEALQQFQPTADAVDLAVFGQGHAAERCQKNRAGRSSLVLDVVVETGNPADSERCLPMLERHVETYGEAPQRVAFDGGYASRANLTDAKELGVEHVVFHKKCGLETTDMTHSAYVHSAVFAHNLLRLARLLPT